MQRQRRTPAGRREQLLPGPFRGVYLFNSATNELQILA